VASVELLGEKYLDLKLDQVLGKSEFMLVSSFLGPIGLRLEMYD
jgi:hypothetical protein